MKRLLTWLWSIVWCVGLPVLGWWIASRLIENPPIVAPFLFASPCYAFMVAFTPWMIRRRQKLSLLRKSGGLENAEIDGLTQRYPGVFDRFQGKIFVGPLEAGDLSRIVATEGWLWVDDGFWKGLGQSAREFGLVQAALDQNAVRPYSTIRYLVGPLVFLAGYVLASINLWLILPAHAIALSSLVWYAHGKAKTPRWVKDEAALALTGDLKGALQYISAVTESKDLRKLRSESLKTFAKANGIA